MRAFQILSFVVLSAGLAGCAVGPDYHAPQMKLPDGFVAASVAQGARGAGREAGDPAKWWHALNDAKLDSLIERAVQANPSLEIALTRLQEARIFETVVAGRALPDLEASAGAGRGTGSDLTRGRVASPLTSASNTAGLQHMTSVAGFDAAWGNDLFCRGRRAIAVPRYQTHALSAPRQPLAA